MNLKQFSSIWNNLNPRICLFCSTQKTVSPKCIHDHVTASKPSVFTNRLVYHWKDDLTVAWCRELTMVMCLRNVRGGEMLALTAGKFKQWKTHLLNLMSLCSQFFIEGKTTLWQSLEKYYSQEKLAIKCCIMLMKNTFLKTLQNDTYASQEHPLQLLGGHPPHLNTSVLPFQIDVKTQRCTQDLAMTYWNVIYGTLSHTF